jgi:ATP-dependent RNA helicase DDX56/DBP9
VFDYLIATDSSLDSGEADEHDIDADEGAGGYDDAPSTDDESEGDGKEEGRDEDNNDGDDDVVSIEISGDEGSEDSINDKEESDSEDGSEGAVDIRKDSRTHSTDKQTVEAAVAAAIAKKSSAAKTTEEGYGVSRGIDFQGVNFVINFDLPLTAAAYTHRIGRTARGGASGTALSFVSIAAPSSIASEKEIATRDQKLLREIQLSQPRQSVSDESSSGTGGVLAAIGAVPVDDPALAASGAVVQDDESKYQPQPLIFNMKELDTFRYRVEETIRSVTNNAVREFRAAELKQELLNSAKLKSYFAENPDDLKVIRHDSSVAHPIRVKEHLKFVPSYLVPPSMRGPASTANQKRKKRKAVKGAVNSQDAKRQRSKMRDPLQSLSVEGGGEIQTDALTTDVAVDNADGTTLADGAPKKYYTGKEALGRSTSGRQHWKEKHRRGKFNPKRLKREASEIAGAFTKSKGYK